MGEGAHSSCMEAVEELTTILGPCRNVRRLAGQGQEQDQDQDQDPDQDQDLAVMLALRLQQQLETAGRS